MHQLACAISQPSLAESTSPVSSFYLQRQTSTLPPHPDAIPRNTTEQQRTTSRTQQRAFLTPLELDVMPRSSSDWQQYPVTSGWQHQHQQYTTSVHSHQQRSMTSSHQRLCQSNPGPMLGPTLTTQQQQQHPAAKPMANQEARALGTAATTLVQQTGLFSEPPSASWGREWPAGSPSDHQMALNFSSLAISNFRDPSGTHSSCAGCLRHLQLLSDHCYGSAWLSL